MISGSSFLQSCEKKKKQGNATFFPSGSWRPALMSNLPLASGLVPPDNDLLCCHAAMRTTSAPTYFPVFQGYADGGLFANNPALSAIGRAYAHFPLVTPENTVRKKNGDVVL